MRGYITLPSKLVYGPLDTSFVGVLRFFGQLMVAMFLFYSGFGIHQSCSKKPDYFKNFFSKRFLKILFHFALAVLAYVIVMTALGKTYPWHYYLTCWVGWDSVGNSNWFIFVILSLYLATYLSALIVRNNRLGLLVAVTACSIILWIAIVRAGKGTWWVDTIMTYPLGFWYSHFKDKFDKVYSKKFASYIYIISISAVFLIWRAWKGVDDYGICACLFCLFVVALSSKIKLDNRILRWLGECAFSIYILMRLPMNVLDHYGMDANPFVFAILSIALTLLMAHFFNKLLNRMDRLKLFNANPKSQKD